MDEVKHQANNAEQQAEDNGHTLTKWTWITRFSGYCRCTKCGMCVDVDWYTNPMIQGPALNAKCNPKESR